uniref:tetratricopeptide repeat protein n=1 Tax=Streptomyces bicolor TaxID=66874 RepID=UPI00056D23C6
MPRRWPAPPTRYAYTTATRTAQVPSVYEILARIHCDTDRVDLARTHAEQSLRMAFELGEPTLAADSLITLGSIHRMDGDPGLAAAR